jgi:hypothetical protein
VSPTGQSSVFDVQSSAKLSSEAPGLPQRALLRRLRRVDHRVEDGTAHVLREQVGVHAAEFGAVGDAEVVQLVVAEDLAHEVHVAGRVGGTHIRKDLLRLLLAGRVELLGVVQERAALGGVVGCHVLLEVRVQLLVVPASHARAAAHPAGVEAHQVVAGAQGRVVLAERGQGGDAGAAWPAEVEQQRTDPLAPGAAGLGADHREVDRVPVGLRPVQRHLQLRALPLAARRVGVSGGLAADPVGFLPGQ